MENERRTTKKKPTKIEEMTKEQIRQAITRKRECNAKAQSIVESLLDRGINETYFIQCLPDINQCHFDDVVEERAISLLCGYPICSQTLSERDIPKQKYRISVKTNKVYDITARKNFCSNTCYKSAMFVKQQMLTSPLWFREYEDIPTFNLLAVNSVGSLGQEVDIGSVERISLTTKQLFTSINDFTSASLNEITMLQENDKENYNDNNIENNTQTTHSNDSKDCLNLQENKSVIETDTSAEDLKSKPVQSDISTNVNQVVNNVIENSTGVKTIEVKEKKSITNLLNIVGDIVEKPEKKIDPILVDTPDNKSATLNTSSTSKLSNPAHKPIKKKQYSIALITIEVEKSFAEWFTLDTLLFLFGEEKVKEMVADKGDFIKEYLNNYAKTIFYSSNTYDQYQALCRKLNMLELEDRRCDAKTKHKETKPLPDYTMLQEESKHMLLKVKAFYSADTKIPETSSTSTEDIVTTDESSRTQLPLIDKNAQLALRRRILCEHLNKVLPDIMRSLGLLTLSISSDVRLIVNTFKLKPNNIMFKPIQWALIAIVIIKLLSIRDRRLQLMLESPTAYQHMQLLLLSYKQDGGYLERLISWLTDIDRLLDTNDTQLTIES